MKMILKLISIPILIVLSFLCLLGKLASNISATLFSLLAFILAGCGIYCIVHGQWLNLAILAGMGFAAYLILFLLVAIVYQMESWKKRLRQKVK